MAKSYPVAILVALLTGCAPLHLPSADADPERSASGGLLSGHLFDRSTDSGEPERDGAKSALGWNWVVGLPVDLPHADTVRPLVRTDIILSATGASANEVTAHSQGNKQVCEVTALGGQTVRNLEDLYTLSENALRRSKLDKVRLSAKFDSSGTQTEEFEVRTSNLSELLNLVASDQRTVRLEDGGVQHVLIREPTVRCKVASRLERSLGLLQLVVSLEPGEESATALPVDVTATCNNAALRCLTVSDCLGLLYDKSYHLGKLDGAESTSFASVAARDDYLIPGNYKQLSQTFKTEAPKSLGGRGPALTSVPGVDYPGTPVLADARALTGRLLTRQFVRSGDKERTGWIMFAGESLKSADTVEVVVDLGNGPTNLFVKMSK